MSDRSPAPAGLPATAQAASGRFPRVLVIGCNFDLVTGGGITLTNLFRDWPREQLAVAAFHPSEVDPAPCARQYLFGSDEKHWVWPLSLAIAGCHQPSIPDLELVPPAVSKTAAFASKALASKTDGAFRSVATAGVGWLGGADALRTLSCSQRLHEWARDVRPDLIYTQLASLGMIRLVTQLADGLSLPIALHMMDDWPSVIYGQGLLGPHLRAKTDRAFRTLVARASATLAISQRMAEVYRLRYGREWEVFHNPVDIARWAGTRRRDWSRRGTFKLVYAGRVGQGIESSLVDMCLAVEELKRRGLSVGLDIFTPSRSVAAALLLASFDGVAVHDAIEDERMPEVLAAADLLVLPYDFSGRAAKFACLSYPTKAPAYMATGVPTLVYAPRDHALTLEAMENGWAYVVAYPGAEGLIVAIRELANNEPLRKELAERAATTCESLHDARVVRQRFHAALARAAAPGGVRD